MKMTPTEFEGAQPPIDGYAPDGFRVAGKFFPGPLILSPRGAAPWETATEAMRPAGQPGVLDAAAARPLAPLSEAVDVLLVGVGPAPQPLPEAFRAALEAAGLRFDPLATPAACRTYNVLLSEGRRVAAALLPVGGASPEKSG